MKQKKLLWGCWLLLLLPLCGRSQDSGLASGIAGLQGVLEQLYSDMLPMCSQLIGVGQGLAGLAALGYIGVRVGKHIAAAEPVDVFPLLRPIVIGTILLLYPFFIAAVNGVLSPTVSGTAAMVNNANASIATLLQQKEAAIKNTPAYQLFDGSGGPGQESFLDMLVSGGATDPASMLSNAFSFELSKAYYNLKNTIKVWLSEILQVLYEAAALCINTIRTFNLIVLAVLGPLVLGLSVFDVFRPTLANWLARYVGVYLWLPVANIFGAIIATIQTKMIQLDIQQIQSNGDTFFSATDIAYMIFLIIGIFGYFKVPSVAAYIVQAGGGDALARKAGSAAGSMVNGAMAVGKTFVKGIFL